MEIEKYKLFFRIVFITGFIMVLVSAIDYLAGGNKISPVIGGIGIIFVANGIIFGHVKNRFSKLNFLAFGSNLVALRFPKFCSFVAKLR